MKHLSIERFSSSYQHYRHISTVFFLNRAKAVGFELPEIYKDCRIEHFHLVFYPAMHAQDRYVPTRYMIHSLDLFDCENTADPRTGSTGHLAASRMVSGREVMNQWSGLSLSSSVPIHPRRASERAISCCSNLHCGRMEHLASSIRYPHADRFPAQCYGGRLLFLVQRESHLGEDMKLYRLRTE
jgi:hypothetical protein